MKRVMGYIGRFYKNDRNFNEIIKNYKNFITYIKDMELYGIYVDIYPKNTFKDMNIFKNIDVVLIEKRRDLSCNIAEIVELVEKLNKMNIEVIFTEDGLTPHKVNESNDIIDEIKTYVEKNVNKSKKNKDISR